MWISNFFGKSTTAKITQGANLIALAAALYAIYENPESAAEFGLDTIVHGTTALTMRQGAGLTDVCGASALNLLRLGAIYSGVTSGCSPAPMAALVIDTGFHLWNTFYSLIIDTGSKEEQEPTPVPSVG